MRNIVKYIKPNPPIEKTTLDRVEFFQKITLPQDYKELLLSYNGGKLSSDSNSGLKKSARAARQMLLKFG